MARPDTGAFDGRSTRTAFAVVLLVAWGCDDGAAPAGEGGRGAVSAGGPDGSTGGQDGSTGGRDGSTGGQDGSTGGQDGSTGGGGSGGEDGGTVTCLPPAAGILAIDGGVLCLDSAHWGNGLAVDYYTGGGTYPWPVRWGRHEGPLQAISAADGTVSTLRWTAGDEGLEVVETEVGTLPTGGSAGVVIHDVVDLPFGERVAIAWTEPTTSSAGLTVFDETGTIATYDVAASALAVVGSEASWRLVYFGDARLDGSTEGRGVYAADFAMGELVGNPIIAVASSSDPFVFASAEQSSFDRNGNLFVSLRWSGIFGDGGTSLHAARASSVAVGAEAAAFDNVPVSMRGPWAALAPLGGAPGILLHGTTYHGLQGPEAIATFEEVSTAFAWSESETSTASAFGALTLVANGDDEIWVIASAPDDGSLCGTDTAVYVLKRC